MNLVSHLDWFEHDWQMKSLVYPWSMRSQRRDYRFKWAKDRLRDGNVLDVGAGDGEFQLIQNSDIVEPSVKARKDLLAHFPQTTNVIGKVYSSIGSVKPELYDNVTCFQTLEHIEIENQEAFMAELFRVLKTGGKLLLTTPIPGKINDPLHFHEVSFYELLGLVEKHTFLFKIYFINKVHELAVELNCYAIEAIKQEAKPLNMGER